MFLPIGPAGEVPVDASGTPLHLSRPPGPPNAHLTVRVTADLSAVRMSLAELDSLLPPGGRVVDPRAFGGDRVVSRAVAGSTTNALPPGENMAPFAKSAWPPLDDQ